jgi:hypothetical protein
VYFCGPEGRKAVRLRQTMDRIAKGGMMRHGPIDWLGLYISLIAAIMLVTGIIWCVSPMRFVNGYRVLIFRDKITRAKWWESAVCSNSGRVCGAMLACFAVFILYKLWIGEFR